MTDQTTATVNEAQATENVAENTLSVANSGNVKAMNLTYGVVQVPKKRKINGVITEFTGLKAVTGEEEINKAKTDGTYVFSQTIGWDDPINDAGIAEILPAEKERVETVKAGLKSSRINPRVKRLLEEVSYNKQTGEFEQVFQPVDGQFDIREILKTPARTKKDAKTRALDTLRKIPMFAGKTDEELMAFLDFAKASGMVSQDIDAEDEDDEDEDSEAETGEAVESEVSAQSNN